MKSLWRYVRVSLLAAAGVVGMLFTAILVHWLVIVGVFDGPWRNPYEAAGICYTQDWPGATSRYVEYSFVTCGEPHALLAEPVGADQAVLSFEDVDGDGRPEAIVESSRYKCRFGGLRCYGAERFILKICPTCELKARVIRRESLPELEVEEGP